MSSASNHTYPASLQTLLDEIARAHAQGYAQELLIELADEFQEVPSQIATRPFSNQHLVPHCESEAYVWLEPSAENAGKEELFFAVENPQGVSAKALAVVLQKGLSGQEASAIGNIDEQIVYAIFGKGISMGKGLGLVAMVQLVQSLARKQLGKL